MKTIVSSAGKLAVTVGLLYFALRGLDLTTAKTKLVELDPAWTIGALVACLCQLGFGAARWSSILQACGERITGVIAYRLVLVGNFFSQTLPSTVGGDGVRLLLLQRSGVSWRSAAYSVFLDRMIGLIVLALMVAASVPWSFQIIGDERARLAVAMTASLPIMGGIAFIAMIRIPARLAERWFVLAQVKSLAVTGIRLLRSRRFLYVAFASVLSQLFAAAIAWCAAQAVAVPLTFGHTFLLILPVTLITAIPISVAGWGVREQALQFAFVHAGLSGSDGVLVSLLFGAVYLVIGLLGGLIWLVSGRPQSSSEGRTTTTI